MPVWLDAIPDKAAHIPRPDTRRWLLFLVFVMLGGITLTFWNWTTERTGFVFWFSTLGLPFCSWGLLFSVRRFAYKAEQVGAESRNVERKILIEREVLRGQRYAWILGSHVQTLAGNKSGELLTAMVRAVPVGDILQPRGCTKPVRYAGMIGFQEDFSHELKATVSKLATRVKNIADALPLSVSCWLMLDCESDIYAQVETQLKDELSGKTERVFRLISGKGLAAFDTWLDKHWDNPSILAAITLSVPASPLEGDADAITLVVLSNRKATDFPDALCLHRPEIGTNDSLSKTLNRALLWARLQPEALQGSWFTGAELTQGSCWNKACEDNGVTFSLTEQNLGIDPVLGYAGGASPWLAIMLAGSVCEERGPQVIAAQPAADKDDIWITVIAKEEIRKGSPENV